MTNSVDVARASDQIDALIDKRAAGREETTVAEEAWKSSVRRHNAKLRRQHRAEWFVYSRHWLTLCGHPPTDSR